MPAKRAKPPATPDPPAPAAPKRAPTSAEAKAVALALERYRARPHALDVVLSGTGDKTTIEAPHADDMGNLLMILDACGTGSQEFAISLVTQLARIARPHGQNMPQANRFNALLAVLNGAKPESEVEAMLLAQMATANDLAMEMAWRAKQAEYGAGAEAFGGLAVRFMRVFALQAEALGKLKRGGEQRVKVEHVHVHPGGQAIVGNVQAGGGVHKQSEDQPHAINDASDTLLRCQDAGRQAMPIPADGERPL